jgi:hypothetical protein
MSRASKVAAAALVIVLAPGVAGAQAPIPMDQPPAAPPPVVVSPAPGVVVAPAPGVVVAPAPGVVVAPAPGVVVAPAPGVVVAPAPGAPVNPADGPGECVTTTTTTTRCTGAAAPFASHPAPPPVLVLPPTPAPSIVPHPVAMPAGWQLQIDPDGNWWRVHRRRGQPSIWAPGLVLWLSSYTVGIFAGVVQGQPETTFPIAGTFVAAAFSESSGAQAAWAIDGLAQLGGLVLFIVGASVDGKLERLPVSVTPTSFYGGGSGVALTGRF